MTIRTIPIDALFGQGVDLNKEAKPQELLDEAEVIFGVDVMSQREFLLYGKELLQEIAKGDFSRPTHVIKIEVDEDTEELEKLIALIKVVKGKVDYESEANR